MSRPCFENLQVRSMSSFIPITNRVDSLQLPTLKPEYTHEASEKLLSGLNRLSTSIRLFLSFLSAHVIRSASYDTP